MKKEVKFGKYIIRQNDTGSIEVHDKLLCSNTKEALREIAKEGGFKYENNWNTQQLGRNIIGAIDSSIMRIDVISIVEEFLINNTRIFFNEREFQLHLSKRLEDKGYTVHMEYLIDSNEFEYLQIKVDEIENAGQNSEVRSDSKSHKLYLDIVVEKVDQNGDKRYMPIELKYKTTDIELNETIFTTTNKRRLEHQGARNLGCYGFWRDVERVEKICKHFKTVLGIAVILTNDSQYWRLPTADDSNVSYAQFSLRNKREIDGNRLLSWNPSAKTKNYEEPKKWQKSKIELSQKSYTLNWVKVKVDKEKENGFRYLLL